MGIDVTVQPGPALSEPKRQLSDFTVLGEAAGQVPGKSRPGSPTSPGSSRSGSATGLCTATGRSMWPSCTPPPPPRH